MASFSLMVPELMIANTAALSHLARTIFLCYVFLQTAAITTMWISSFAMIRYTIQCYDIWPFSWNHCLSHTALRRLLPLLLLAWLLACSQLSDCHPIQVFHHGHPIQVCTKLVPPVDIRPQLHGSILTPLDIQPQLHGSILTYLLRYLTFVEISISLACVAVCTTVKDFRCQ